LPPSRVNLTRVEDVARVEERAYGGLGYDVSKLP
jgi:hypothetical protein